MMTNWITLVCPSASGVEVYFALHGDALGKSQLSTKRQTGTIMLVFFAPIIRTNYQITLVKPVPRDLLRVVYCET